jgi:hypothetical protein
VTNTSPYRIYKKRFGFNRHLLSGRSPLPRQKISAFNPGLDREALRALDKKLLLLSYEEEDLENPRLARFLEQPERYVGDVDSIKEIVLVRDAYNLFASLLKSGMMNRKLNSYYINKYKRYCNAYINITNNSNNRLIAITYDNFVRSGRHRLKLSKALGGKTVSEAPMKVPSYGGGSSFQPTASHASKLDTFNRWQEYAHDPFYKSLFDDEIVYLTHKVFNKRKPF